MPSKIASESPVSLSNLAFWVGMLMLAAWIHRAWYVGNLDQRPECMQPRPAVQQPESGR